MTQRQHDDITTCRQERDFAREMRGLARHPPHGTEYVPVHQGTLTAAAERIERLEETERRARALLLLLRHNTAGSAPRVELIAYTDEIAAVLAERLATLARALREPMPDAPPPVLPPEPPPADC